MKRYLLWLGIIASALCVIGGLFYFTQVKSKQVDFFGTVETVKLEGETVYLTVRDDWNVVCEIAVPRGTVCRDRFDGKKMKAADIPVGWLISCNFKGETTFSEGVNRATAKGTISVYRKTSN